MFLYIIYITFYKKIYKTFLLIIYPPLHHRYMPSPPYFVFGDPPNREGDEIVRVMFVNATHSTSLSLWFFKTFRES
jgi:hypothetical protein